MLFAAIVGVIWLASSLRREPKRDTGAFIVGLRTVAESIMPIELRQLELARDETPLEGWLSRSTTFACRSPIDRSREPGGG